MRFLSRNFSSCLSFNGVSSYIAFPNPSIGANATISARVKTNPSIMTTAMGFFDTNPNAVGAVRIYTQTSGNLFFDIGGGETTQYAIRSIPNFINRWSQVTLTLTAGTMVSLYVNGLLLETHNDSKTGASTTFEVGRYNAGNYFSGLMGEIVVDPSNAWTATQVRNHYYRGFYPNAYLSVPLTDGLGTIATDASGNAHNGTITSAVWSTDTFMKARGTT